MKSLQSDCLIFVILFISPCASLSSAQNTSSEDVFQWIRIPIDSQLFQSNLEPVGVEGNVTLFLCRANTTAPQLKPGKLWINNGEIFCAVENAGTEFRNIVYQILEYKRGTISWIPVAGTDSVFENAIPGGILWNGDTTYVCRGRIGNDFIVGHVGNNRNECYVSKGNDQHIIEGKFELLVLNAYGIALQGNNQDNLDDIYISANASYQSSGAIVHSNNLFLLFLSIFVCI